MPILRGSAVTALCLALLAAGGCRTTALPTPTSLLVPASLAPQNIEFAILVALAGRRIPVGYDPREDRSAEEHENLVRTYLLGMSRRNWVVQSRQPGRIEAILSRPGRYHLRVAVRYDAERAEVELLDSSGLQQTGTHIHRNAAKWVRTLERRIQGNFDEMAQWRGGAPSPTALAPSAGAATTSATAAAISE